MSNLSVPTKQQCSVVEVIAEKCVNCHACITACPVKYANNGSDDHVTVHPDACIGCGNCLKACKHEARILIDDFQMFLTDLQHGLPMIAIVAPSIAANFPNQYLNLNGWLKQLGIEAVFDVSFGAELTIMSYLQLIKDNEIQTIVAQPCPVIVNYIQIYQPELLPYLAPVHSPMGHTMKMIRQFYPEYENCRIAAISPCIAKKREFIETGYGDYNITYQSIETFIEQNGINLDNYPSIEFDNPPAERGVLFSSPGGFMRTAERWCPDIRDKTRKIEGSEVLYKYLEDLPKAIDQNYAPLMVDCLNCEFGCNAGPGTTTKEKSLEELEALVEKRKQTTLAEYQKKQLENNRDLIENILDPYWKPELYQRKYHDLSENLNIRIPDDCEIKNIYASMHKSSPEDFYNCNSCGYGECKAMAVAIHNGLNRPENCHFYLLKETHLAHEEIVVNEKRLNSIIETSLQGFIQVDTCGNIQDANPAMLKLLKVNSLAGKTLFDLVDERNAKIFRKQLTKRFEHKTSTYAVTLNRSDGKKVSCMFSASALYNDNKERTGSFAIVTDLTAQKRTLALEFKKHEAEATNRETCKFLSNMSHEIRNPMNSIMGFSELLLSETNDTEQQDYALSVLNSSQCLLQIINDIMDFAKIEAGKLDIEVRPCSIPETLVSLKETFRTKVKQKRLEFTVEKDDRLPEIIITDPNRLRQCLINIVDNAIKFTDNGSVRVHASVEPNSNRSMVRFDIQDTGIGIARENQQKIFDKFTQGDTTATHKHAGTGLGLTISSKLAKLLDGYITLQSQPNQGSTFSMLIPLTISSPEP